MTKNDTKGENWANRKANIAQLRKWNEKRSWTKQQKRLQLTVFQNYLKQNVLKRKKGDDMSKIKEIIILREGRKTLAHVESFHGIHV